jgi:hypothetical protein
VNALARLSALPFTALLFGATPAAQEIPWRGGASDWIIIVPQGSPVKFNGWHQYGYAQFDGRFVLTGQYALTLTDNCERPGTEDCLVVDIDPDPEIAARLPRVKHSGDVWITIREDGRLRRAIVGPRERAELLSGKIRSATGRTSIVVDRFSVGGDCEQVWYSARFVAFAKPSSPARTRFGGGFGCGY